MSVPVPPVVDSLLLEDEMELDVDVGLDDEVGLEIDVGMDDEVGLEDDVGIDDDDDDEDDEEDDDDEEVMDEDQDVPPLPPSPVFSDVTYESDTSEALGYALETEVPTTYEVGESSTVARVTPAELRALVSHLRRDVAWCRNSHRNISRRVGDRQFEVAGLRREVQYDRRVAGEMYLEHQRQGERLSMLEQSNARVQERLDLLDERMAEKSRMVDQLTMREVFLDIDSRRHYRSIQSLWDELHATQWQVYYDRLARFRPSDSVDVMAVYGGRRESSD